MITIPRPLFPAKRYVRDKCEYTTNKKSNMNKHIKSHNSESKFGNKKLLRNGKDVCILHKVPKPFQDYKMLRLHLHFAHSYLSKHYLIDKGYSKA